ncbi:MAG: hypothetical protein D3924_19635 [Candidatus Electrothrix sp. AR4]|nr:hypothetical protein [Candidatus Electrothrix sp. AR4]
MDNIVREVMKTKIVGFKGTAFQDALDRIYLCIYGDSEFQRVKQKHDEGSDGILNGDTIIAAYAPEKYRLADFKKKVKDDFNSYRLNWESTHCKWQVVTNLEKTAKMIKFVNELKSDSPIVCIDSLLHKISDQTWTVKRAIFSALDIPEHYLTNDLISMLIEDLIQISDKDGSFEPYEKPAYIQDKIDLNVSEEHRAAFADEYGESLPVFPIILNVVKSTPQTSVSSIRSKIRTTYMSLSGNFEQKMNTLVEMMAQSKVQDDYYRYNMRMVMLYFFEQCLFGKKPTSEVYND